MTEVGGSDEQVVDLDDVGDGLPVLIEDASRRGGRLVVVRGGQPIAVVVPLPRSAPPASTDRGIDDDADRRAVAAFRAGFADMGDDEIVAEMSRAIARTRPPVARRAPSRRASSSERSSTRTW